MSEKQIELKERIPVLYRTDVLVAGGGVSGVCAAVAARQSGASVILLEKTGLLGGNFTNGVISTLCGFYVKEKDGNRLCVGGLAKSILDGLTERNAVGPQYELMPNAVIFTYHAPDMAFVLDNMVEEAGVRVLFHQFALKPIMRDARVEAVAVAGKGGLFAIEAKEVIDASGDGDLAFQAGVPRLDDGGPVQFPSTTFHLGGVDTKKISALSKAELKAVTAKAVAEGKYELPRVDGSASPLPMPNEIRCNVGRLKIGDRPINPLDIEEASFAELEGRRQAYTYLDFARHTLPGCESAYITRIANTAGIRESRRLRGVYVLKEEDVVEVRKFDDAILCSSWPIEQHKEGAGTRWVCLPEGEYCQVPLRCIVPEKIDNLLFPGKTVSGEQAAHAAVRAGAPCMCMGEAAGVTAALAIRDGLAVRDVPGKSVVNLLRERGAFLP